MMYQCDTCGCYLDPGEGRVCDECQQMEAERRKQRQSMQDTIHLVDGWQYDINFDGGREI